MSQKFFEYNFRCAVVPAQAGQASCMLKTGSGLQNRDARSSPWDRALPEGNRAFWDRHHWSVSLLRHHGGISDGLGLHSFPGSTIALPPRPGVRHLAAQICVSRSPAKLMPRAGSVCNECRRIARPARTNPHRKITACDFPNSGYELADRPSAAGAEIKHRIFRASEQHAQSLDVRIREIGYMDVVAHPRAICRRIVITVNREA